MRTVKKEAISHPKMFDLASRLSVSHAEALGHMTLFWNFVEDAAPRGDVGKWADGAIARASGWLGDATIFVAALVGAKFVDECPEHRLIVHDWPDHCQSWVRSKLLRSGQWFLECYGAPPPHSSGKNAADATPLFTPLASGDASGERTTINQTKPNRTEPNRTEPTRTPSGVLMMVDPSSADDDQKILMPDEGPDAEAVRETANRLVRKLFPNRGPRFGLRMQDRVFLLRMVALSRARLSENWLWDSAEAVARKRPPPQKPIGYFRRVAAGSAQAIGVDLSKALERVVVPERLAQRPTAAVEAEA